MAENQFSKMESLAGWLRSHAEHGFISDESRRALRDWADAVMVMADAASDGRPPAPAWQPIETAPADVDLLLGWDSQIPPGWQCKVGMAQCTRGKWFAGQATHWQALPAGPTTSEAA